ncbi:uncharacterized protein LOC118747974 [Rhagoletis pomonella]|uniref:uncharacterized protein LOC118747974 n=1 Tax=Rhagoletis pomonella TaxID=28610 RepID=UPI0017859C51|nr:uncharacterized protein LOC118747974 [Rhagoletis pomonella]
MDPSLLFYLSSSESENDERVVRKQLRGRSNPLALSDNAFIKRFRLSKEAFQYVLSKTNINCDDTKAVPAALQLAASLSLLASARYVPEHGIKIDVQRLKRNKKQIVSGIDKVPAQRIFKM